MQQLSATATRGTARTHSVVIDRPVEKEGTDEGMMGGEMLLVALGGCFMSNLLAAIRARSAAVSDITVAVTGIPEGAPARFGAVEMHISAHYDDVELMEKLVTIAERGCLVANTLKPALPITIHIAQTA
jgi:putative redox protein